MFHLLQAKLTQIHASEVISKQFTISFYVRKHSNLNYFYQTLLILLIHSYVSERNELVTAKNCSAFFIRKLKKEL